VKFTDADQIGIPIRTAISSRSLKSGGVELKLRKEKERNTIPLSEIVLLVKTKIRQLEQEFQPET